MSILSLSFPYYRQLHYQYQHDQPMILFFWQCGLDFDPSMLQNHPSLYSIYDFIRHDVVFLSVFFLFLWFGLVVRLFSSQYIPSVSLQPSHKRTRYGSRFPVARAHTTSSFERAHTFFHKDTVNWIKVSGSLFCPIVVSCWNAPSKVVHATCMFCWTHASRTLSQSFLIVSIGKLYPFNT